MMPNIGVSFAGSSSAAASLNSPLNVTGGGGSQGRASLLGSATQPNWTLIIIAGFAALALAAWLIFRK